MLSFYLVPFIIVILTYFCGILRKNYYLSLSLIILITSLRYSVGGDYPNYYGIYNRIKAGEVIYQREYLFYLMNLIVSKLGLHFNFLLFSFSCILYTILYKVYKEIVGKQQLYILLLFYFLQFNNFYMGLVYIRQSLASGVLLLSVRYIEKKSFLKFSLCVTIATLIHTPAILFIFFYLLGYKKINRKEAIIIVCINLIYVFLGNGFLINILKLVGLEHYVFYFNSELNVGSGLGIMLNLLLIPICIYFSEKINKEQKTYYDIFLIGIITYPIIFAFPYYSRILLYLKLFSPIGIYLIIVQFVKSLRELLFVFIVLFLLIDFTKNLVIKRSGSDNYFWSTYRLLIFNEDELKNVINTDQFRIEKGAEPVKK